MDNKKNGKEQEKKESQLDILLRIGEQAEVILDETEEPFAVIQVREHQEVTKLGAGKYEDWLRIEYYKETGRAPNNDSLNQVLATMKAKAKFQGKKHSLHKRVALGKGAFYYDLCDENWRVVKITKNVCKILKKSLPRFTRTRSMKAQVKPLFDGDINLLRKHMRFVTEADWIICLVYIVSCYIPEIPHPILVLAGEKGASKTTTLKMLKAIIDPSMRELLAMPNNNQDLALTLANQYMPCFDNLETLSTEKSNLLCMASTGGGISKRMLYSNDEEITLSFKRCVAMNGINVVATRADLLDRAIILTLDRIPKGQRKQEKKVWDEFNKDLPNIVGGAMKALSTAMSIYPKVEKANLPRMADFAAWGYAIAEALGIGGDKFFEAYERNQDHANVQAIESNPVAVSIVALMATNDKWKGTVTELYQKLGVVATLEKINTTSKQWPNAPHALSRRLNEIRSNLEQVGITFSIKHMGDARRITLVKK
jgi:hypothetical protein